MTSIEIPVGTEVLYTLSELAYFTSLGSDQILAAALSTDPRFTDMTYAAAGRAVLTAVTDAFEDPHERAAFVEHTNHVSSIVRDANSAMLIRIDDDAVTRFVAVFSPDGVAIARLVDADWLAVQVRPRAQGALELASDCLTAVHGFLVERYSAAPSHTGIGFDGTNHVAHFRGGAWNTSEGPSPEDELRAVLAGDD